MTDLPRDLPEFPSLSLRRNDCDDGYEVLANGRLSGYVYPDVCGGYKPFSTHGRPLRNGFPASRTPDQAAGHLLDPMA